MNDSRKVLKWVGGIVAVGMVIFLLIKYGSYVPLEVWEIVADVTEEIFDSIGD